MKMKIFAAGIAAVTVGMLAPIPAMGVDKPSDSVSTSMTATPQDIIDDWHKPHPVPPLSGTMPAGTHPATAADMQKFVTSLWVSPNSTDAKIDFSQSKLYKDYPPIDFLRDFGPRTAKQLKDTTVPDNTRSYVGGTMCPKLRGLAWFEGNRIHTMSWWKTYPTKGCGLVPQIEDTEFQNFLKNATLYFNAAGDRVYVERHTDGAISEWKLHS